MPPRHRFKAFDHIAHPHVARCRNQLPRGHPLVAVFKSFTDLGLNSYWPHRVGERGSMRHRLQPS